MPTPIPQMGQGPAVPVVNPSLEQTRDDVGMTNPNLHKRVDSVLSPEQEATGEKQARTYSIGIYGVNDWRTTEIHTYDDFNNPDEIP